MKGFWSWRRWFGWLLNAGTCIEGRGLMNGMMNATDLMELNDRLRILPSEANIAAGLTGMETDTVCHCNDCPYMETVDTLGDPEFCMLGYWYSPLYDSGTDRILRPDSCPGPGPVPSGC